MAQWASSSECSRALRVYACVRRSLGQIEAAPGFGAEGNVIGQTKGQ